MQILQHSTVLPEEIDSLGHMNVRYYMQRMGMANESLVEALQLDPELLETSFLRRADVYTRFRKEQFEGAQLHTRGGVIAVTDNSVQSYVEVVNGEEVAASFIVASQFIDTENRTVRDIPNAQAIAQHANLLTLPDYAMPRSLSLTQEKPDISLSTLNARIKDVLGGGMMSGRRETLIEEADVDSQGWLREDIELMFLPFAKMAQEDSSMQGPPVFETADGKRVGWAVMETRTASYGKPRLGANIAYFSADVNLAEKTRVSRRWALDTASGDLLGISDTVGLCLDLDARKAVPWPEELYAQIKTHLQPDLA